MVESPLHSSNSLSSSPKATPNPISGLVLQVTLGTSNLSTSVDLSFQMSHAPGSLLYLTFHTSLMMLSRCMHVSTTSSLPSPFRTCYSSIVWTHHNVFIYVFADGTLSVVCSAVIRLDVHPGVHLLGHMVTLV